MKAIVVLVAISLTLAPHAGAQGLKGEYYSYYGFYPRLPDEPRLVRVDGTIAFSDDPAHPAAPFGLPSSVQRGLNTVRWTGSFEAMRGTHRFSIETDNAAVLSVDGRVVVDLRANEAYARRSGDVDLEAGPHFVELFYARSGTLGLIGLGVTRLPGEFLSLSTFSPSPVYPLSYRSLERTLDFEARVRSEPFVTDQYAASHGVHFIAVPGESAGYPSKPKLREIAANRVVYNDSRDPVEMMEQSANMPLLLRFERPLLRVSLKVGAPLLAGAVPPGAILRAFDSAGRLVGMDMAARLTTSVETRLEVARGSAEIASISLDYGNHPAAETIDDLRVETVEGAPPVCTPQAPSVEFVHPTPGQHVPAGDGRVTAKFLVREPCGILDTRTLNAGFGVGRITSASHPGCMPPFCFAFEGSVPVAIGAGSLTATATNHDGMTDSVTVAMSAHGARVHVTNERGDDVERAEVFVGGARMTEVSGATVTDANGNLELPIPLRRGSRIVVRAFLFENTSPRRAHQRGSRTPGHDWNYRVYTTSTFAGNDGQFVQFQVWDPKAVQELALDRRNTLIGMHVVASIEWDASVAELEYYRDEILLPASQYLFNATDGQMYFEQIDILDDSAEWDDTDIRIYANNTLRPYVGFPVGSFVLGGVRTHMNMRGREAPAGVENHRYTEFQVYGHEFGHYGLGLYDEYAGTHDPHCTDLGRTEGSGTYQPDAPRASCIMNNHFHASKLCSAHSANPHSWMNYQGTVNRNDCWNTIVDTYQTTDFAFRTPVTRDAIPGTMAGLPVRAWAPVVTLVNASNPGLCMPFTIVTTNEDGTVRPGASVWLITFYGGRIDFGITGTDGTMTVTGMHVGDRFVSGQELHVRAADCSPTM